MMTATGVMAGGQGRTGRDGDRKASRQTQELVDHVTGLYHRDYPDYTDSTSSIRPDCIVEAGAGA